MSETQFMARAAAPVVQVVREIKPDQLGSPTPCAEYDVRELVNHLLVWGPPQEGAARKEIVPPAGSEADLDLTGGDWAGDLEAHIDRLVAAWSEPAAWTGVTHLGGPTEMPAALVGSMVAGELVVHGWDLARATGQHVEWDDDLVAHLLDEMGKTAELGREMGIFGPEVAVPATASTMDRLLALTGRDPGWRP